MVNFTFTLSNFEYFLLILIRIASFVFVAPFFGERGVPNQIKIGLTFFVSIFMYNLIARPTIEYDSVIGYAVVVLVEGITGLLIGFAAYICNSIILFAGNIIDMDIGLSMATEFNPEMSTTATISGNFYYYLVMLFLVTSNMHTFILRALCDSYQVIPIGGAIFDWGELLVSMIKYVTDAFVIGFRIFLPFFAVIMIMNCILGIMAKVSPQMNMFSVGIQIKLLAGLAVMFLTIYLLPNIANFIFEEVRVMVVRVIEGMY